MTKKDYLYSMENMRGIAILMVVLGHMSTVPAVFSLNHAALYYSIFSNGTAVFVFIAGFFFVHTQKNEFSYFRYVHARFKSVVIPYIILGSLASIAAIFKGWHQELQMSSLGYYLWSMLVGGAVVGPLWFVPMIVIFILASFLLYPLGRSKLLPVVATITIVLSCFSGRPIMNANPVLAFFNFLGFYILGMAFAVNRTKLLNHTKIMIILEVVLFAYGLTLPVPQMYDSFFDRLMLPDALQIGKLGLILMIFSVLSSYGDRPYSVLKVLSKYSFSIFFLHGFWLAVLGHFILKGMHATKWLYFLELGVVMAGVVLTISVSKKVLGNWSKYVIGS